MRAVPAIVAFALLLAAGCALPSGSHACTEIGCSDGLHVRVTPTSSWPHGTYRFEIVADAVTSTCTGALPLPKCGTSAIQCEGPPVAIDESGCALPPSEHAFSDLQFPDAPSSLQIEIQLDGTPVVSQTWSPQYETLRPNGPSCEPTCRHATVNLAVEFSP